LERLRPVARETGKAPGAESIPSRNTFGARDAWKGIRGVRTKSVRGQVREGAGRRIEG
jgi:hypothetical protein